ncbi:345_t:CDS:2 [Gigaspora margarita]|uniref:345_t:CDS:1 n=1 Tax=Gigaspora margarita TaxID=4874 RepID=A0ABM8VWZ9_GIGMA|nr:345_t:CDS:2 [Gigaspora margarita]
MLTIKDDCWDGEEWKRHTYHLVALKILKEKTNFKKLLEEIENYFEISDKTFFIRFMGISQDLQKNYIIVMELAPLGSLRTYLEKNFYNMKWEEKITALLDITYEIITGSLPYDNYSNKSVLEIISNRPKIPKYVPEPLAKLIWECWKATDRPTSEDLHRRIKRWYKFIIYKHQNEFTTKINNAEKMCQSSTPDYYEFELGSVNKEQHKQLLNLEIRKDVQCEKKQRDCSFNAFWTPSLEEELFYIEMVLNFEIW